MGSLLVTASVEIVELTLINHLLEEVARGVRGGKPGAGQALPIEEGRPGEEGALGLETRVSVRFLPTRIDCIVTRVVMMDSKETRRTEIIRQLERSNGAVTLVPEPVLQVQGGPGGGGGGRGGDQRGGRAQSSQ